MLTILIGKNMFGTLLGGIFQFPQNLRTLRSPATISKAKTSHCASLFPPFSEPSVDFAHSLGEPSSFTNP